jgi:hypothetical protein
MIQERSQVDIDYERQEKAYGRVGYGYFEYPDGTCTWIAPYWRSWIEWRPEDRWRIEKEIDRRTRIVAMGA